MGDQELSTTTTVSGWQWVVFEPSQCTRTHTWLLQYILITFGGFWFKELGVWSSIRFWGVWNLGHKILGNLKFLVRLLGDLTFCAYGLEKIDIYIGRYFIIDPRNLPEELSSKNYKQAYKAAVLQYSQRIAHLGNKTSEVLDCWKIWPELCVDIQASVYTWFRVTGPFVLWWCFVRFHTVTNCHNVITCLCLS